MSADPRRAALASYLDFLKSQRQLADHTVSNYGRDLRELLAFVEALPAAPDFAMVSTVQIRKFAAQLHARGLGGRSIARKLSAWRGFFGWLSEQVTLSVNPVKGVKAPKRSKPLPKALSPDDAVRLVAPNGFDLDTPAAACNHAMFELLYSSGLRVSELTSLDLRFVQEAGYTSAGWIDFAEHSVTVTGKGKKMRSVPIGQPAMTAIAAWITLRPQLLRADPHPLFLTDRGARMTPRLLQTRIKAHAQKIGIPSNVHPHVLRHSFATHVLQSSGDLRAVQEMLGHASISSTQVYTSLDFLRLAQVYDQAHPRAKKR